MSAAHDPAYVAELAQQLALATEFRIPCPGHPHGRLADLRVVKRDDGRGDTWAITDGPFGDAQVWTGRRWSPRSELARDDIYRWTRQQALEEAARIASTVTAQFHATIAHLRAEKEA